MTINANSSVAKTEPAVQPPGRSTGLVAVVTCTPTSLAQTRATVRSLLAQHSACQVIDIGGSYIRVGAEQVVDLADLATRVDAVTASHLAVTTMAEEDLAFFTGILACRDAIRTGARHAVLLAPGVVVCGDLSAFAERAGGTLAVVAERDADVVVHAPAPGTLVDHAMEFGPVTPPAPSEETYFNRSLVAFGADAPFDLLESLARDWRTVAGALDAAATSTRTTVVHDSAALIAAWRFRPESVITADDGGRLLLDDVPIVAVDLTRFDPKKPWILAPLQRFSPPLLLSERPALARFVAEVAARWDAASDAAEPTSAVTLFQTDPVLRQEARRAQLLGGRVPDPLGSDGLAEVDAWALELVPESHRHPVARYLAGVRATRSDLVRAFANVPGDESIKLARWAIARNRSKELTEGIDHALLRSAAEETIAAQPTTPASTSARQAGVNVVGYLSGELGLGESGRLVHSALDAAGVATSTFDVSHRLLSRTTAAYKASDPVLYDTTLMCVNGGETPDVQKQLSDVIAGTRRIGMWYWELEEFPDGHAAGFDHVDEVWAATDFIRDSISALSPGVPVRTVMPPLPQRRGEPGPFPERFGIDPTRPYFLFTFDFLSLAGRKNPYGLVEAFQRAFPERGPDRPQLVIKSINADQAPADAEQLRIQAAGDPDIVLVEEYLPNDQRFVLVEHCAAFVSLHRAEGLGLTIAEAMAWGKPVVSTSYGGPMQFLNPGNALFVGWTTGHIPEDIGPYPKGCRWAEPDLDEAAAQMRRLIDDPALAERLGAQGAKDIRELHNADVAGARMREVIAEGRVAARTATAEDHHAAMTPSAPAPPARAESAGLLARRVASRVRRELRTARTNWHNLRS